MPDSPLNAEQYAKLALWQQMKKELDDLQSQEKALRDELIASGIFPTLDNKREGTQTIQIGNGWRIKATKLRHYNMTNSNRATEIALGYLAYGNPTAAAEIVTWKPDLRSGVFKKLVREEQEFFTEALTITQGQSQLELIPPPEFKQ
jgi:hypothetical protein